MCEVIVCVRRREEKEEKEPGIQNQKQEPHTKMWGTILQTDLLLFICSLSIFQWNSGSLRAKTSRIFPHSTGLPSSSKQFPMSCPVAQDSFTLGDTSCVGAGIWTRQTNRDDDDSRLNYAELC